MHSWARGKITDIPRGKKKKKKKVVGEKELKLQLVEGRKPGLPGGAAETGVRDSNSWRGQQAPQP